MPDAATASFPNRVRSAAILTETDKKFFQPLWRRLAVTLVCAAWCAFEFVNGDSFWAVLAGAAAAFAVWNFFIVWRGEKPAE